MTALASTDVTITVEKRSIEGKLRRNRCKIAFGDGALTYPTGGVAMPAMTAFGLKMRLDYLTVFDESGTGYMYKYDKVNKKLMIYVSASYSPAFTGTLSTATLLDIMQGTDIKGSAAANVAIAGGTLPTNGSLLANLEAANNTTNFTIALNPDQPRNVSISFKNTNAGASTGNAVSCVITGTFRGAAQTETISFSAAELTSTAQNEVATKFGSKPFDKVTSITNPTAQPAGWQHAAGPGSKIGFPVDLATPAEADVIKATVTAADYTITGKVDTTNMTLDIGVTSDGADYTVVYKHATAALTPAGTIGALAAGVLSQLANTVAPAAQTLYAEAVGW